MRMRTCGKAGCFRGAEPESFYCRFHNRLDVVKMVLALVTIFVLIYFMSESGTPR